jgi:ubiquinone/menaquinone biosynthesis C-methylase UbiE
MDAIGRHLGRARSPLTVLDLGAGTGRFAAPLADAFDARVIAVEPSAKMRAEAERAGGHPRVAYGDGRATDIPAPSEKSCALQAVAGLGPPRPRRSYEKSRANLTP